MQSHLSETRLELSDLQTFLMNMTADHKLPGSPRSKLYTLMQEKKKDEMELRHLQKAIKDKCDEAHDARTTLKNTKDDLTTLQSSLIRNEKLQDDWSKNPLPSREDSVMIAVLQTQVEYLKQENGDLKEAATALQTLLSDYEKASGKGG